MPEWDSKQYLQFEEERTRPCRDLAHRIAVARPGKIIDLGCGPGNSTAVLAQCWPESKIIGLDSSTEMIEKARRGSLGAQWVVGTIQSWADSNTTKFDIVFSNAALQWVEDHAAIFPKLMEHVIPGGALGVQVPGNFDATAHRLMRELVASERWRSRIGSVREWHVHDVPFYYDALAPHAQRLDLWESEYIHVLSNSAAIVEWYKGTGLRPFLEALHSNSDRDAFIADYFKLIQQAYPPRRDGRVLFPFRRIFMIAYRGE
jgi:trans-aconitate 2-methyltransferase